MSWGQGQGRLDEQMDRPAVNRACLSVRAELTGGNAKCLSVLWLGGHTIANSALG